MRKWWNLPSGPERDALKNEQATCAVARLKPPRWKYERGPGWTNRGPGWVTTNYHRVEFDPSNEADRLWAEARCMTRLYAPAEAKPRITQHGTLKLDYKGASFLVPILRPSDVAFAIKEMWHHEQTLRKKQQ